MSRWQSRVTPLVPAEALWHAERRAPWLKQKWVSDGKVMGSWQTRMDRAEQQEPLRTGELPSPHPPGLPGLSCSPLNILRLRALGGSCQVPPAPAAALDPVASVHHSLGTSGQQPLPAQGQGLGVGP